MLSIRMTRKGRGGSWGGGGAESGLVNSEATEVTEAETEEERVP